MDFPYCVNTSKPKLENESESRNVPINVEGIHILVNLSTGDELSRKTVLWDIPENRLLIKKRRGTSKIT